MPFVQQKVCYGQALEMLRAAVLGGVIAGKLITSSGFLWTLEPTCSYQAMGQLLLPPRLPPAPPRPPPPARTAETSGGRARGAQPTTPLPAFFWVHAAEILGK